MPPVVAFIHELSWPQLPAPARAAARRALLDLLGVAATGARTRLSTLIRDHAAAQFAAGDGAADAPLLFDGRRCSAAGAALAGGMTIDAIDAHDGHNLTKGHAGCGVLPALLALAAARQTPLTQREFLTALVCGYEIATRAGIALHRSAADYHTSGAWVALAAAALGARLLGLSPAATRDALGVAEYHGPRSPMMRCIDHPTMLKDGSGWGAMCGVSAALLARAGFSGAPALSVEGDEVGDLWNDLGSRWRIGEQYYKPFPVCRWAQPAVTAALALRAAHELDPAQIRAVAVTTFHQARRLACREPASTEQAQYSLPFPVAAALVRGELGVGEIDGDGLRDAAVLSLSRTLRVDEDPRFNAAFPARRFARIAITLADGRTLCSDDTEADGDPRRPLTDAALSAKYLRFAEPALGRKRAAALRRAVVAFGDDGDAPAAALDALLYAPGLAL